jgi:hypothetical protein
MTMFYTMTDGIAFVESTPPKARRLATLKIEIGGVFSHAQLKNLDDVKQLLAKQAKSKGGNAIIEFSYGQKSVGMFRSLVSLDDVVWYGSGTAAVLTADDLR